MWDYSDKVMDHFRNPRNVGKIEGPDGVGTVGSLACGDALTLMFKLGPDKRIAEVKFQTFGCASAIASSSALTEMVIGKTIEEAERITNKEIADYLGGLPDQKMHCSVMGREALEAAIHNYRTGETSVKNLEDHIVCTCFGVSENEIRRVVTENGLTTVDEVTNFCKAGGGCGMCRDDIQKIIDSARDAQTASPQPPAAAPKKRLTNIQKMKLIEEIIDREIRPQLQKDGGDIELIDIEGNVVTIAFRGMCAGCQSAAFTRQDFIQAKLREFVDPDITVVDEC
ncbi:MAG: Fe-S cluster assembly protein NifU [Kiritimatiellae bacterium]|jgi:NifU-like protein|nr:Fe-S cluster assembly protein NifU [Kiritimatiellia bacterium]MDD2349136.1 Fe-S cluster assembly protein NifU [Kiritimatiellia bacterium]MDD3584211.1 Fe-S cluster assembly protein NifU [Kiritimatiellia bacterium]HHU16582.1 Fe-S cluster assembly protein NifU [Lentisphaerota bacterium]HON48102.1 Fe-S cluster assembly protein NifU [Kiritimatiellia bacterium]